MMSWGDSRKHHTTLRPGAGSSPAFLVGKKTSFFYADRDAWDASNDGKLLKKLKRNIVLCSSLLSVSKASANDDSATIAIAIAVAVAPATAAYANANATNAETDEINLRTLDEFHNREFVEKLSKARKMVTDQQLKLKTMRTSKVKDQQRIETKIFKVLKEIGV